MGSDRREHDADVPPHAAAAPGSTLDVAHKLLEVAAAGTDGVEAVVRVVRDLLAAAMRFDRGEVAILGPLGFERWSLTDHEDVVCGDDLVRHVSAARAPRRADDLPEVEAFPQTAELMEGLGLRSLLVLPLTVAGGPDGAVVVASRQGWAFVAASLGRLTPVAAMAGLALERARTVARLRRELETARREIAARRPDAGTGEASPQDAPPASPEGSASDPPPPPATE